MESRIETGERVAAELVRSAAIAADFGRRFVIALSPAVVTPQLVALLAADPGVSAGTHVFLADNRFGACGHCEAEVRAMLKRLPLARGNLHLDATHQADPVLAARAYEQYLRAFFGLAIGDLPRFDAVVLQSAAGGGTAGVPARSRALEETCRLVTFNRSCERGEQFFTLTPPVIQYARRVYLMACAAQPWRSAA